MAAATNVDRLSKLIRSREKLTVDDVCAELRISKNTFYDWRRKGRAPRCKRLPNGSLLIVRADFDEWFEGLGDAA